MSWRRTSGVSRGKEHLTCRRLSRRTIPERLPFFIYLDQAGSPSLELVVIGSGQLEGRRKPATH
jgi:hypothetical protein